MKPFMMTVNVGQRGEIVIPKKAREALGMKTGGQVQVYVKDGSAELVPVEDMATVFERLAQQYGTKDFIVDSDKNYEEMMEEYARVHR
jgi:AbrB family looped-hinge helix DNA binding protein